MEGDAYDFSNVFHKEALIKRLKFIFASLKIPATVNNDHHNDIFSIYVV